MAYPDHPKLPFRAPDPEGLRTLLMAMAPPMAVGGRSPAPLAAAALMSRRGVGPGGVYGDVSNPVPDPMLQQAGNALVAEALGAAGGEAILPMARGVGRAGRAVGRFADDPAGVGRMMGDDAIGGVSDALYEHNRRLAAQSFLRDNPGYGTLADVLTDERLMRSPEWEVYFKQTWDDMAEGLASTPEQIAQMAAMRGLARRDSPDMSATGELFDLSLPVELARRASARKMDDLRWKEARMQDLQEVLNPPWDPTIGGYADTSHLEPREVYEHLLTTGPRGMSPEDARRLGDAISQNPDLAWQLRDRYDLGSGHADALQTRAEVSMGLLEQAKMRAARQGDPEAQQWIFDDMRDLADMERRDRLERAQKGLGLDWEGGSEAGGMSYSLDIPERADIVDIPTPARMQETALEVEAQQRLRDALTRAEADPALSPANLDRPGRRYDYGILYGEALPDMAEGFIEPMNVYERWRSMAQHGDDPSLAAFRVWAEDMARGSGYENVEGVLKAIDDMKGGCGTGPQGPPTSGTAGPESTKTLSQALIEAGDTLQGAARKSKGVDYGSAVEPRPHEAALPKGMGQYSVDPGESGGRFFAGVERAAREHKFGAAVQVKGPEFYSDPGTKLWLTPDDTAGAAVTADGDLVSVFKVPGSKQSMTPILADASEVAITLDGFDINGVLPDLYAKHGWRPVARVRFNTEYAPEGWSYDLAGKPDVVLMVRDKAGVVPWSVPDKAQGGYAAVKDSVPVFDDWDEADAFRREFIEKIGEGKPPE